jgi:hypothetical protein
MNLDIRLQVIFSQLRVCDRQVNQQFGGRGAATGCVVAIDPVFRDRQGFTSFGPHRSSAIKVRIALLVPNAARISSTYAINDCK